jgi:hypothetical protein
MELESSMVISGLVDPLLTGTISAPTVTEVGGVTPNNIIRTDQDWEVTIDWSLKGSLLGTPFFHFIGEWIVSVYLESMGPSKEYVLPEKRVGVDNFTPDGASKRNYTATIEIAPNEVVPGIYRMVVAVTYQISAGKPGPIAGFHEGAMLQLYKAE